LFLSPEPFIPTSMVKLIIEIDFILCNRVVRLFQVFSICAFFQNLVFMLFLIKFAVNLNICFDKSHKAIRIQASRYVIKAKE
jgi:hypothetical protein